MLDKLDRLTHWPQYLLAALIGLVWDEIRIRRYERQARRYG